MIKNINTQKGFIIPVIILIGVIVLGGGGYVVYKNSEKGNSDVSQSKSVQDDATVLKEFQDMITLYTQAGMTENVEKKIKRVAGRIRIKQLTGNAIFTIAFKVAE